MAKIIKSDSSLQKLKLNELPKNNIIRALACLVCPISDYGLRELYQFLDIRVTDRTSDIKYLISNGFLSYYRNSYSYYYASFHILNPEMIFKAIASMSMEELKKSIGIADKISSDYLIKDDVSKEKRFDFVYSLWHYLHGEVNSKEKINDCFPFFNAGYNNPNSYIASIMNSMVESKEMHGYILSCSQNINEKFLDLYIKNLIQMSHSHNPDLSRDLFFELNGRIRHSEEPYLAVLFVIITELMRYGQVDRLIERYSSGNESDDNDDSRIHVKYLKAIKSLHENNTEPIHAVTSRLIEISGSYILNIPQIAFFPMLALLADRNPSIVTFYQKLIKGFDKEDVPIIRAILDWVLKGNIGATRAKRLSETVCNPSTKMLSGYFVKQFNMGNVSPDLQTMLYYSQKYVNESDFNYLKLLYCGAEGKNDDTLKKLENETRMPCMFSSMVKRAEWEKSLDILSLQLNSLSRGGKKTASTSSNSRVAYLISTQTHRIQPVLQTSKNGTTWSKGRNIALKTFYAGSVEGMTEQDKGIIPCIRLEQGWGDYSTIDYYSAIFQLAGHPFLFTDDSKQLKIEITRQDVELSVTTTSKGDFKLSTNLKYPYFVSDDGIYINSDNPLSIIVIKLSKNQITLLNTLLKIKTLPKEAKPKLAETLSALSSQMTVMSDLVVKKNADVKRMKGWPVIVAQLVPDNEMINVTLYAKPLKNNPPYLTPGKGPEFVNGNFNNKAVQARRDFKAETENLEAVKGMLKGLDNSMTGEYSWELDIENTLSLLASIAANGDIACVEWPEGARMTVSRPTLNASAFSFDVKNTNNWFEIEGNVRIDENTVISVAELMRKLRDNNNSRFIQLKGNDYIALSKHLADTLRAISQIAEIDGDKAGMSALNVEFMDDLEKCGVDFKADKNYRSLLKRIEKSETEKVNIPTGINAELRDYQKDGYRWLQRLHLWGAGACLADDMGLGKTLQAICLLHANRNKGASLVVAPTSLLLNWRDEIIRFAPALNVEVINNYSDSGKRREIISNAGKSDVVVISYGLMTNEQESLADRSWNIVALDEAHTIKNRETKMSQAAMTLKADMRLALTGTPLQNRLAEIWNIFRFLNPGLLGSFQSFTDNFINPIEHDSDRRRQRLLKRILSPFLLRRSKTEVLQELPEKTEITVRVELSEREKALYENLRREAEIAVEMGENSAIQALAEITKLRQAACNPRLVDPKLELESSKTHVFMELVASLMGNNHRALVFSQFTSHLALIREALDKAGIEYLYLDGSTPAAQRARLVAQFQNTDVPLFLISLKAGGLGLNLTAADYVIHLDPWWNPAIEDQASDRSHRIGQQNPVTVYRLISADTIEEKILRLHSKKKSLADALLEGTDMSARLTKEEILSLLAEK